MPYLLDVVLDVALVYHNLVRKRGGLLLLGLVQIHHRVWVISGLDPQLTVIVFVGLRVIPTADRQQNIQTTGGNFQPLWSAQDLCFRSALEDGNGQFAILRSGGQICLCLSGDV